MVSAFSGWREAAQSQRDSDGRATAVSLSTTETVEYTAPGSGNLTGGRGGVRNQRAQDGSHAALLSSGVSIQPNLRDGEDRRGRARLKRTTDSLATAIAWLGLVRGS